MATKRITLFRTASGWAPHQDKKDKEEDPTIQLHTSLEGQAKEEIRNFLSAEFELRVGCGLRGRDFDIRVSFLLCFPGGGLVAAVDLVSDFLSLAVFLVAVTVSCLGASVTV